MVVEWSKFCDIACARAYMRVPNYITELSHVGKLREVREVREVREKLERS